MNRHSFLVVGRAEPLRPLHHTGHADLKCRRHRPAALTRRYRSNTAHAQVKGIASAHQILASPPASILNQNYRDLGIPNRFRPKRSCSRLQVSERALVSRQRPRELKPTSNSLFCARKVAPRYRAISQLLTCAETTLSAVKL